MVHRFDESCGRSELPLTKTGKTSQLDSEEENQPNQQHMFFSPFEHQRCLLNQYSIAPSAKLQILRDDRYRQEPPRDFAALSSEGPCVSPLSGWDTSHSRFPAFHGGVRAMAA